MRVGCSARRVANALHLSGTRGDAHNNSTNDPHRYASGFAGHDGQATTSQIADYCRPEIVFAGDKPADWQIWANAHNRAPR